MDIGIGEILQRHQQRRPRNNAALILLLAVIVVVLCSTSFVLLSGRIKIPGIATDPDRAAVRAWLKENLNDPHFEEVHWSPTAKYVGPPKVAYGSTSALEARVIRLRFRTPNAVGALQMGDEVFVIKDGKAYPTGEGQDWYIISKTPTLGD